MDTPWSFFDWEDIYEERKYFVQTTLRDSLNTRKIMNRIVYCASCAAATRIEEHCLTYLTEIIDRFKAGNKDKEPEECDWLDFVFHYNKQEPLKHKLLQDELLKEDLGLTLEETAEIVSATITKEYNTLLNSRTKASWNWP